MDENQNRNQNDPLSAKTNPLQNDEEIVEAVVAEEATGQTSTMAGQRKWATPPLPPKMRKKKPLPMSWREPLAVLALVVLCDLTIYRGHGWAGYALLFALAPLLLCFGMWRPRFGRSTWIVGAMLVVLAAKMVWCVPWLGWLMLASGFVLVVTFAVALSGRTPYALAVVFHASQILQAGYNRLNEYGRRMAESRATPSRGRCLSVVLPLIALFAFGTIFIIANPEVLKHVSEKAEIFFRNLGDWLSNFSGWELAFWIAVLWIGAGLLRPLAGRLVDADEAEETTSMAGGGLATLYAACRNTLITVVVLFAVYLVFEFATLWFREFPEGFYYSGYAHQGAAWLTLALALATIVLSLVFSGPMIRDPRVGQLRAWAWIWSLENFILAVAVYHRMFIYVGFNGMTRMRIVGFFGMSAVVIGFALVLWKIKQNYTFGWLVQRHLWTLAVVIFLLVITPVDTIVVSYNVRQILEGDLKPSVQITEHPISAEGVTLLAPLLQCEDETIREGVRALLAERDEMAEATAEKREKLGWTTYQMADRRALDWFRQHRDDWAAFSGTTGHSQAMRYKAYDAFKRYAYQWY